MPENRQVQANSVSNPASDTLQEPFWRLKVRDDQEGDAGQSGPYPDRPGEPDCVYYLRTGQCGYGSNCRYNHPSNACKDGQHRRSELPQRTGQPDCGYFLKTGTCKYGPTCKYHHPRDRHGAGLISLNTVGLPIRQEEKSCSYYMRTGLCKYGAACKFNHPQPSVLGTGLAMSVSSAGGATGSSIPPSSGLSRINGPSSWTVPRAPYLSAPRVQGPQAFMPVVYSPSQGILPTHGWNTYLGNMSSVSSSYGILGPSLAYNYGNQIESGSSSQPLSSTSFQSFPERPDQPECRYFMSTGSCKYGPDCKYHHPKERVAQIANTMGPYGLPLRPGQPVCSYYNSHGICKYGPTCKYDHPVAGFSYNYGVSLPSLPILNSSVFSYPRNSTSAAPQPFEKSSKLPAWIPKSDVSVDGHQEATFESPEDETEAADSPPQSSPTSETPQDQSD